MIGRSKMMLVGAIGALAFVTAGCAKSSDRELREADKAAEEAREKDQEAQKATNEARTAQEKSVEETNEFNKKVRDERADYRKRLEKDIAETNAKLAPLARGDAGVSAEAQRLTRRKEVLGQHLNAVGSTNDRDWPQLKERIEADLDEKGR